MAEILNQMKKAALIILSLLMVGSVAGQESQEVYSFLRLPVSAHAAALGGDNISLPDDDPSVIFHNPSLLNNVSDKSINLNFMTYMEGAKTASASFVKALKKVRGTWGVSAQYMDYGSMKETTMEGTETGSFSAKDIALAGSFAYMLSKTISGGITARLISSKIGSYSSAAVAIDLGANYLNEEKGWSISITAKNLGGQIKAYEEDFERIPLDLQVGVSKRLIGAPLRLHATLARLNNWDEGFLHHVVVGADVLIGDQFYLAAGYNFRRAKQMKITDTDGSSSHGAGISLGGGMHLQRFKLQVAYAKYHVSSSSLLVNATYSL